jgi:hypothetical protein
MEESKPDSLQIDDKIDLHRKGWRLQSILLIFLFLFILAAALGLFGDGVLGKQTLGEKNSGVWLEYDRFGRKDAPGKLEVHLAGSASSPAQLVIPSSYLENFHIEAITPAPNSIVTHNNQVVYNFKANGPLTVVFRIKPDAIGKVQGSISANNQTFNLNHFIYP